MQGSRLQRREFIYEMRSDYDFVIQSKTAEFSSSRRRSRRNSYILRNDSQRRERGSTRLRYGGRHTKWLKSPRT
jgi:hypothetical protein